MRRKENAKFFPNSHKFAQDSKPQGTNPCFGPTTSYCGKVTYLSPVKGASVCRLCGNYHVVEKVKGKKK